MLAKHHLHRNPYWERPLGNLFRWFEWKYCAVSENVFFLLCLLYIYTFPIATFHFFVNWLSKVQNLAWKGPNSGVSRLNGVPNKILRVWYITTYMDIAISIQTWKDRVGENWLNKKRGQICHQLVFSRNLESA